MHAIATPETDQRQGVTATQHAVMDLLEARTPMWAMGTFDELAARLDREACSEKPDFKMMAALALHLAERQAANGHGGTAA
ncbi:MAG: hypothetical protein B7Y35_05985 [Sphingomonadales bacterium 28-64-96]|nr:MAG: hypothetical protein B7Y35_05985 [Sphingomonadales bacterium 28-64-96]